MKHEVQHYGLLDSYFFQAASISNSGFPWVSGSPGGPTELDFKGSGCDHEVLGVLESKTINTRPNLTQKKPIFEQLLPPSTPKTSGLHKKALTLSFEDPARLSGTNGYPGCEMLVKISRNYLFFLQSLGQDGLW